MLDPGTGLGDTLVAPLLTLGQRLVARALPLDLVAVTRAPSQAWVRRKYVVGGNLTFVPCGRRESSPVKVVSPSDKAS